MDTTITQYVLNHLNWLAILVAGVAYWMLGALWFSALFGKVWAAEMEKIGIKIQPPAGGKMARMYLTTLFYNILASLGMAILIVALGVTMVGDGIKVGLMVGILFSAATQLQTTLWEGRSMKLTAIDVTYPILGTVLCSAILTFWQ